MHMLIVTFGLEGLTNAEYYRGCDEEAPLFADVPGLISKVWLSDPASGTYGGIYAFRDEASLDSYLGSELFRSIGDDESTTDVRVQRYAVLEGPTRVTRGLDVQDVQERATI